MALHANSCLMSMDCYISDSFEKHSKANSVMHHPTTITGLRYRPFSFASQNIKAVHVVGLARQNWFENYCWCLTTVYSHSRSCGTMTQSNRVDSSVLCSCVTMKVGIRALRWSQGQGNIMQLGALEVRMRLYNWGVMGVCQRKPACILRYTFQHLATNKLLYK